MDMAASSSSVSSNGIRLAVSALAGISASKRCNPVQISAHGTLPLPFSLSTCSARRQLKNQKIKEITTTASAGFHGRLGGTGGGAGVLERPGLDQSQYDPTPSAEEGGEIGKVRQKRGSGGGDRYRVLLLDHERHTESQVATVLPKVVPSITPEEAKRCFYESRQTGVSLVIVTVKKEQKYKKEGMEDGWHREILLHDASCLLKLEHAEFYAQMMARCGLRSAIEPDADVL